MKLSHDWKWVAKRAWSMRLILLSGVFAGADVILPLFVDSLPRNVFAILAMLSAIGGAIARVVDQPKMERRNIPRTPDKGPR